MSDRARRSFQRKSDLIAFLRSEKERWERILQKEEMPAERDKISIQEVLDAHFHLLEFFADIGEGVGGVGPKAPDLLVSAVARQFAEYQGKPRWNRPIEYCASLMYGLIKNHPFHDANKRTAFLTSLLHLQKIGRTPTASHQEYEDFTVYISDNKLGKYAGLDDQELREPEACVEIIADFLRKNTRDIDRQHKFITYRQLDTILHKFDMYLANPHGNRIDVMKREGVYVSRRVCNVGFHSWSKEVSRTDLGIIREAGKLDLAHGYDSQAFFNGVETPLELIKKYEEPLRRLAFR